jgi:hypothetical protein
MPIAKDKIFLAFILPFIFWVYLAFSSQMTIAFDSIGFENDGKIIKTEGLKGYLKNTPQKEPLYACSIALSMKLADALRVDYKKIQTGFQILLLLLGQFLLFRLLRLLELNPDVIMAALLYYGFSPGLISCGFDLYSEIITLPFILLSIILITKIWRFSLEEDRKSTTLYALFFALTATTATFSKAVLTVVYPLFVLPFVIILIQSFLKKRNKRAQCVLIFMVVFFSLFNISIHHYKSLNKKYHGHYTFTDDRGISMLYTIAFKRTTPLTQTDLGLAVTSIPGINVCRKFYGQICEERLYDSFALAHAKMNELASDNIPKEKFSSPHP